MKDPPDKADESKAKLARERIQTAIALSCVVSIGVGCWWLNPALALIVPAAILLAGVVYGRTH